MSEDATPRTQVTLPRGLEGLDEGEEQGEGEGGADEATDVGSLGNITNLVHMSLSIAPLSTHPINTILTTQSSHPPPSPLLTATTVAREPLTQEDLLFGRELPRGRLYITCIEGEEMRKAHETGKQGLRIDPYIKFRLGAAERLPFFNTTPVRKQEKDPSFENEVTRSPWRFL